MVFVLPRGVSCGMPWRSPVMKALRASCMGALFDWNLGALGLEIATWLDTIANSEFCLAAAAALGDPLTHEPSAIWTAQGLDTKVPDCPLDFAHMSL